MIQIVGLIVAIYALARLAQVPIEQLAPDSRAKLPFLWIISLVAGAVIAFLAIGLVLQGAAMSSIPTR